MNDNEKIFKEFKREFPEIATDTVSIYSSGYSKLGIDLRDGSKIRYDPLTRTITTVPEFDNDDEKWRYEFGDRLAQLMYAKGFTQQELAEYTDISQSTISRYISGTAVPNSYTINKIARVLGYSTSELVDF